MKPQPSYAQAGSIYYICLLRDELLLHQGRETQNKTATPAFHSFSRVSLTTFKNNFVKHKRNKVVSYPCFFFFFFAGDCVYLMRDSRRTPEGQPLRQSYRLLSHVNRDKLDIFRIEKLWKNEK